MCFWQSGLVPKSANVRVSGALQNRQRGAAGPAGGLAGVAFGAGGKVTVALLMVPYRMQAARFPAGDDEGASPRSDSFTTVFSFFTCAIQPSRAR